MRRRRRGGGGGSGGRYWRVLRQRVEGLRRSGGEQQRRLSTDDTPLSPCSA